MRCEEIRELLPELALGIADGEERANALRHLSRCAECRRKLEDLSEVADELILLAPEREAPLGFESRVLDRLGLRREPSPGLRSLALTSAAAAAAAAAALTAGVMLVTFEDERALADRYRETLEVAGGEYFEARPLEDLGGPGPARCSPIRARAPGSWSFSSSASGRGTSTRSW